MVIQKDALILCASVLACAYAVSLKMVRIHAGLVLSSSFPLFLTQSYFCFIDLAENDDDESLNYVEAQPERKQLSYSSTFTPFVPSSFIPPSPVAVNPNHQYTLSPSEVEKLEKFMEDKKNALGEDIADLYPAIWKLRFHKYGGDASRQNIPWDPELEPKLPLYVTTQIVNPISLYNLPVSVKDQFYSLESKRRWFMSKNQEAQAKAVEDDIKALAKKHSCSS